MNTTQVKSILINDKIYFNHPLMKEKNEIYGAGMMNFHEMYKTSLRNGLQFTDENKISNCVDKAYQLLTVNKEELWKDPNYKSCYDEPSRFEQYVNEWFLIEEENFDKFIDLVLLPSVA